MEWRGAREATADPLLGRFAEREAIAGLLEAMRDGLGGALVFVGEAGIGKTRLLDYAAAQARAAQVELTRLVGVEAEQPLGYGALHRLLRPHLHRIDRLPPRQRDALNTAFGLADAAPLDRHLVGLATLTLLSGVALELPLLCLIDDVHWLDRESAETLAFVARRLQADSLGLIFAARTGIEARGLFDAMTSLRVDGLPVADARELLALATPGHLDAAVADRIVAGTGGNPLALIELGAQLNAEQLAGVVPMPDPLPVSRLLEAHFQQAVAALPPDTRTLLLLIAAAPTDDPTVIWHAAGVLGLSARAAAAAVEAGVLDRAAAPGFRHPLIRSSVYAAASGDERRRIHAALATATDPTRMPDRRAWHRAAAALGADDAAAADLDAASDWARARGGYSAQALFLSKAAELTTEPTERAGRYLAAAEAHLASGDHAAVQPLLDLAAPALNRPAARARALRIRASAELFNTRSDRVAAMMLDAVAELGDADIRMTWELLYEAVHAAVIARDPMYRTTLAEVADAVTAAPRDPDAPAWSPDPLIEALAVRAAHGYERSVSSIQAALAGLRASPELHDRATPFCVLVSLAATDVWDIDANIEIISRLAAVNRSQGALYDLSLCVSDFAYTQIWNGRLNAAEALYAEADDYARAIGLTVQGDLNKGLLYAWMGREAEVRATVATMDAVADTYGLGMLRQLALQALCILDLGLGRYGEAKRHALLAYEEDAPSQGNLMLPLLVEAAVRAGDRHTAARALTRLEERAQSAGTPWALGMLARCRALMDEGDDAEAWYQESIDLFAKVPLAAEQARSRLLFGEWLRRRRRRVEARTQLRSAYESFDAWGASLFAERARTELLATGETARRRVPGAGSDLTPQERQVALLAVSGLTNAEIASRLFITTSTVEFHLNKVFRKLGITSRRRIAAALEAVDGPAPSA
ncbi:LuxR C-terminal-related transcriptional regulator [Actinospica robiniae]|uniref:LuxR C-terminal-related transcriptional regulator n=1 Tax=Actinospica robiniae TaxID=304901 RepID=UPI0003FB0E08|nr:LuxR family transcriptional regulator [Actinospica robiniae]